MDQLPIEPIGPFDATVRVPGSKSLTNRALVLAALAQGTSTIRQPLKADDPDRMVDCLQAMNVSLTRTGHDLTIDGCAGALPAITGEQANLFVGNAGTAARFLTALCCLGEGPYHLDGIPRMRERPIGQLVDPLRRLGARIDYLSNDGYPPLLIRSFKGGRPVSNQLTLQPTLSSQYISALLQIAPVLPNGLTIHFDGPVISWPYVVMTVQLMERFGANVELDADQRWVHVQPCGYTAQDYTVEPDASNASYFIAAAAVIPGSQCTLTDLGSTSLQGDVHFARVLEQMGCSVTIHPNRITVASPPDAALRGIDIDLNAMPDMAQTLGAIALFAEGQTVIRDIGNLRVKETDRLAAMQTELTRLGAAVAVRGDDIFITPPADGQITPAAIDTYDDHRMAMAFAIVGLRAPGVVINDPACVNKTFPTFFEYLGGLRKAAVAG